MVQKFVTKTEEEKQPTQKNTLIIVPIKKRKYDIYDKKIYLNKRTSHIITIGYLRHDQHQLNINLPNDLLETMFKFYYYDRIKELLRPLPLIKELIQEPQTKLFIQKLKLCETTLDFSVENMEHKYENAKNTKTKLLTEIIEYIAENTWSINNTLPILINMISKNLFRSLPHYTSPYINSLSYINDDEKDISDLEYIDPSWPHLKLIYDIFWRLINTSKFTPEMMETYLNKNFIQNLIELFSSRQDKERQYLMMILHKIYGRCMRLRPIILNIIKHFLYTKIIYTQYESHYGISELLQIISVIISGLKMPIKHSWHILFENVLIPLYKSYSLKMFWEALTHCCVTYISKDINCINIIFNKLLQFWPVISPQKEEIFINVISNIIQTYNNNNLLYENYENILIKIINKLSKCLLSKRQTVSQCAMNLFQEVFIQDLIDIGSKSLLNIVVSIFHKNKNKNKNKQLEQVEKIYKYKDCKYWKEMKTYLNKKDKKERKSKNNIDELESKGEDVWVNIKHKYDIKYKYKSKPKLTNAEKIAKRKYYYKQIQQMAEINKNKLQK